MSDRKKKVINAWAMYDWANSAYSLVITSAIFPIYYNAVTSAGGTNKVQFIGREYENTALYSYTLSFSFLIIAAISPLLSGIADYTGSKKKFMAFFCYLGSFACASLFFFEGDSLWIGIAGLALASIGYSGSIVFNNAYLPEIAGESEQDRVSAKGFALGYIGSSLLLIFNLTMILFPQWYGNISGSLASRVSFLTVGIWWFVFAQFPLYYLPHDIYNRRPKGNYLFKGYRELKKVWNELKPQRALKTFLMAFFFYNMGVQTVMYVAATFGDKELMLKSEELIITVLIIQFVAIAGAYLFSWISSRKGNIFPLVLAVVTWIFICIGAWFVYTSYEFYALAFVVGMVMGGIQALSRSTYSKLLPETQDHASYFSFYDVCEKMGIVLGTASFGLIEELTGSMRNSILALAAFFVIGLILLLRVRK